LRIAGLIHVAKLMQQQIDIVFKLPKDQRLEHMNLAILSPQSQFAVKICQII